jgi:anthranilate/para-aminobenzoate synthase component II
MSDKAKIYIIDFEDSFTFNIATELYTYEKEIVVVSHLDFFSVKNFPIFLQKIKTSIAVILGPGPGSPEEYREYFSNIKDLKNNPLIYLMGICLGHQVLGLVDGLAIKPSQRPIHGGQVKINFDNINILVQRYNSLAVFESQRSLKEIQIRQWPRGVSYQFHPESIGTENRPLFFKDLLNFIH